MTLKQISIEIIRPFVVFFGKRKSRNRRKTKEVIEDYEKLIAEFKLIQNKESKLSSTQRKMVRARIVHLVGKGHIKVS